MPSLRGLCGSFMRVHFALLQRKEFGFFSRQERHGRRTWLCFAVRSLLFQPWLDAQGGSGSRLSPLSSLTLHLPEEEGTERNKQSGKSSSITFAGSQGPKAGGKSSSCLMHSPWDWPISPQQNHIDVFSIRARRVHLRAA